MQKNIYILGIGGSTPLFIDLAEQSGYKVAGLYHYNDNRTGDIDHGYNILGSFDNLFFQNIEGWNFMLSMGDMDIRKTISEKIIAKGGLIPTIIHPSAIISRFASISNIGVLVGAGCVIQSDVIVNSHAIIRDQALIGHQTQIGEYCFVGPQALIGAHTILEPLSFIGQKSLLISGKVGVIGEHSLIGAGAVVTKSIGANMIAVGFPAKELKSRGGIMRQKLRCANAA